MIDSDALIAPISPPLTRASSIVASDDARAADRRAVDGAIVLVSMRIVPRCNARRYSVGPFHDELDVGRVRQQMMRGTPCDIDGDIAERHQPRPVRRRGPGSGCGRRRRSPPSAGFRHGPSRDTESDESMVCVMGQCSMARLTGGSRRQALLLCGRLIAIKIECHPTDTTY